MYSLSPEIDLGVEILNQYSKGREEPLVVYGGHLQRAKDPRE